MAVEDSVAQDQIRAFIERIERMEEEKAAIAADIKEIYTEAKGNGFDTKILRRLVTIRKQDANERMEQEAVLELYMSALGMIAPPPSYVEERDRLNSLASKIEADLRAPKADPLAALKADPTLAIVSVSNLKNNPEPQPSPQAGSDLTVPPSPQGQVADIQPETANEASQSDKSAEAAASAAPARDYPAPGEVYWESEPQRSRHQFSEAFGDLGQDHYVINEDISCARSAPIVMIGDTILDGWARYNCARCMVGLDGQTAQYPAVQYAGTDPLIDCIKLNAEGRILDEQQKRVIAAKLTRLEPKRKDDIYRAFELWMEPV